MICHISDRFARLQSLLGLRVSRRPTRCHKAYDSPVCLRLIPGWPPLSRRTDAAGRDVVLVLLAHVTHPTDDVAPTRAGAGRDVALHVTGAGCVTVTRCNRTATAVLRQHPHTGLYPLTQGFTLSHRAVPSHARLYPLTQGCTLSHRAVPAHTGLYPLTQGCTLSRKAVPAHTGLYLLTQGCTLSHRAVPAHTGLYPLTQGCTRSHRAVPSHTGLYPLTQGCTLSHRTVPAHTGLYPLTQGCTLSHRAVPSHTGLYPLTQGCTLSQGCILSQDHILQVTYQLTCCIKKNLFIYIDKLCRIFSFQKSWLVRSGVLLSRSETSTHCIPSLYPSTIRYVEKCISNYYLLFRECLTETVRERKASAPYVDIPLRWSRSSRGCTRHTGARWRPADTGTGRRRPRSCGWASRSGHSRTARSLTTTHSARCTALPQGPRGPHSNNSTRGATRRNAGFVGRWRRLVHNLTYIHRENPQAGIRRRLLSAVYDACRFKLNYSDTPYSAATLSGKRSVKTSACPFARNMWKWTRISITFGNIIQWTSGN